MPMLIAHASIEWIICLFSTNFIHIFIQHCHVKNANNIWIWHLEAYSTCLCQFEHVNVKQTNCDLTLESLFDKFISNCTCECRMIKSWFDTRKLIWQVYVKLHMWMLNDQIVIWHLKVYSKKFMSNCTCECWMKTFFVFVTSSPRAISISKSTWVLDLQSPSTTSICNCLDSWLG
jgi:hypothetical protein